MMSRNSFRRGKPDALLEMPRLLSYIQILKGMNLPELNPAKGDFPCTRLPWAKRGSGEPWSCRALGRLQADPDQIRRTRFSLCEHGSRLQMLFGIQSLKQTDIHLI